MIIDEFNKQLAMKVLPVETYEYIMDQMVVYGINVVGGYDAEYPHPIPVEVLTRKLGYLAGKNTGSISDSI